MGLIWNFRINHLKEKSAGSSLDIYLTTTWTKCYNITGCWIVGVKYTISIHVIHCPHNNFLMHKDTCRFILQMRNLFISLRFFSFLKTDVQCSLWETKEAAGSSALTWDIVCSYSWKRMKWHTVELFFIFPFFQLLGYCYILNTTALIILRREKIVPSAIFILCESW